MKITPKMVKDKLDAAISALTDNIWLFADNPKSAFIFYNWYIGGRRFDQRPEVASGRPLAAITEIRREKPTKRAFCKLPSTTKNSSICSDKIGLFSATKETPLGRMLCIIKVLYGFFALYEDI